LIALAIVGAVLCLVGLVWFGQGIGLVGGSFMTGSAFWAVAGAMFVAFGVGLIRAWRRASRTL
jgi:hypothetical protein